MGKKDKSTTAETDNSQFGSLGSSGDLFKAKDHNGALLMIRVLSVERDVKTSSGEADAIKADVIVLTKDDGKTPLKEAIEYKGTLIFGKVIFSQLSTADTSRWILAELGQGTAKPGQSAPWELTPGNKKQVEIGTAYLDSLSPFAKKDAADAGKKADKGDDAGEKKKGKKAKK